MANSIYINKKIKRFNKKITTNGDKSISIRWVLFSSLAEGISTAKNLLVSEDVLTAINAIKKLGIRVNLSKNTCKIYGQGINGYQYKKNLVIKANNSGTLGRILLGLLINTTKAIKLTGDKSLSKRDFKRIADPLSKFGATFKLKAKKNLPLIINGSQNLKPIKYLEKRGSAQCKTAIIFGGMRTNGITTIKAKKSRNHTEAMCKYLKLPVKIRSEKNYDIIKVKKVNTIKPLNYVIPSDISSSAFFIVLTALSKNSKLLIRNVNINPSRIGVVTILKKMGVRIIFKNQKIYKGEKIADIFVESASKINSVSCPTELNASTIDEFLIIFLVAAKAKGTSYFKNLYELNQKESPRLTLGAKILNEMGIKTVVTKDSIKIYGNPNLKIDKKIIIKDFLKDHRIFMTSVIAALTLGGEWKIHNKESIKTSFPNFLKVINDLKK